MRVSDWIKAFRLRTLALSFALIIVGSSVALQEGMFSVGIFILALLTTLFLQILSNLSNDYGDSVSGVDQAGRVGPVRAVQSGAISLSAMKRAMVLFSILSLVAGIALLVVSWANLGTCGVMLMFGVGILCIVASITYTVGKSPYGYRGLGDVSVFVFFGIVGVLGSYTLYAGCPSLRVLPLAMAIGFFSVGVLNMNNLRDYESDRVSGKQTLVVKMGTRRARRYQVIVIAMGLILVALYVLLYGCVWQLLSLLVTPLYVRHLVTIFRTDDHAVIDSQLKVVSVSTFALSIFFLVGTVLA